MNLMLIFGSKLSVTHVLCNVPGSGSNFSLEILLCNVNSQNEK